MKHTHEEIKLLKEVTLLAGKMLMKSGAETYRVEDTMMRIAEAGGFPDAQSYVTPTAIIFSLEESDPTQFIRLNQRGTDLEKITRVNQISREWTGGIITLADALASLKELDKNDLTFPVWVQILAAAIASGSFLIMFKGIWADYIPAFIVAGCGYSVLLLLNMLTRVKFFAEFIASSVIGFLALWSVKSGWGHELDLIVISSVMPLVPGLLITSAIRDLMAGHLVSGLSQGVEAFLTALAIGSGVAVIYSLWL